MSQFLFMSEATLAVLLGSSVAVARRSTGFGKVASWSLVACMGALEIVLITFDVLRFRQ